MKNCILYLCHNQDIDQLNESLRLLRQNVLPAIAGDCDILLFHEAGFEKERVFPIDGTVFHEIAFEIPDYSIAIRSRIPEYFTHPTHAHLGHKGFTIGYRHMCRFYSGWLYSLPIMANYNYYLRLDSDSFIHTKINYDIFEFMQSGNYNYGFIAPAVQFDNAKVVEGLWDEIRRWIQTTGIAIKKPLIDIPERKMYYTNFELAKVSWFQMGGYKAMFDHIDSMGGIYTGRWGDAPIKYIGINLFMDPKEMVEMRGFTYQHGAVYDV